MYHTSDFDFELPSELIASHPLEKRDASRMLVVSGDGVQDKHIRDFLDFLQPGDVVVFNNSRVIPARFEADGVLDIYQKIVVSNEAHKKIVIGRGGEQLKRIGTAARHDIQDQWGVNARLHLFVRVEPNWEEMAENYTDQGLEFK